VTLEVGSVQRLVSSLRRDHTVLVAIADLAPAAVADELRAAHVRVRAGARAADTIEEPAAWAAHVLTVLDELLEHLRDEEADAFPPEAAPWDASFAGLSPDALALALTLP